MSQTTLTDPGFSALPTEQIATDYIPTSTSTSHPSSSQVRTQTPSPSQVALRFITYHREGQRENRAGRDSPCPKQIGGVVLGHQWRERSMSTNREMDSF